MLGNYTQIRHGLSSMESGQEKFREFKQALCRQFAGVRQIKNLPEKMVMQTVMFLSVLDKKHQKFKSGNTNAINQLINQIQIRKQQIVRKSSCTLEQMNQFVNFIAQCCHFPQQFTRISENQKQILFYTILSIALRQQSKILIFRSQNQYNIQQISNFGRNFRENIQYLHYENSNKKLPMKFEKCIPQNIYILFAKGKYLILYPIAQNIQSAQRIPSNKINHKQSMRVVQSNNLSVSTVEQIFTKKKTLDEYDLRLSQQSLKSSNAGRSEINLGINQQENQNLLKNQQVSMVKSAVHDQGAADSQRMDRQSFGEDSFMYATKVKCSKCQKVYSQIDCLSWNYIYYCYSCLVDIKVDTSDIPVPKMNKFMKDRNIRPYTYTIPCPQCEHLAQIPNYSPAHKNTSFRCNLCTRTICVTHNANIYSCFCYCNKCKLPTMYLQNLKINFCQRCRNRYCFKCNKKSSSFCKCVCRQCLGQQSKTHECQAACHSCNNKPTKLRQCRCGLFICYGCYYRFLENYKEGQNFPCGNSEYE